MVKSNVILPKISEGNISRSPVPSACTGRDIAFWRCNGGNRTGRGLGCADMGSSTSLDSSNAFLFWYFLKIHLHLTTFQLKYTINSNPSILKYTFLYWTSSLFLCVSYSLHIIILRNKFSRNFNKFIIEQDKNEYNS